MPNEFVLVTDDTCDMPMEFYTDNNISLLYLSFTMEGKTYKSHEMPSREFYDNLRKGIMATTSQVSVEEATIFMESFLKEGKDILYIVFSSGLSGTYNSAMVAAQDLQEKYPDQKILVVDSLCASMGEGFFVHKLIELRDAGKTIDELYDWAETNKHFVSHQVTAEDLMHLHRGGRISKTSAVMGTMLGIKPMIHMNEAGQLINIGKVRGRKQSLEAVVNATEKAVGNTKNDIFFICHSDCYEDAEYVAKLTQKRFGINKYVIHDIGPVIGSHTGPGTVALFMMAEHR